jgi:hypothetical protein
MIIGFIIGVLMGLWFLPKILLRNAWFRRHWARKEAENR